jgi:hypothetical protein
MKALMFYNLIFIIPVALAYAVGGVAGLLIGGTAAVTLIVMAAKAV